MQDEREEGAQPAAGGEDGGLLEGGGPLLVVEEEAQGGTGGAEVGIHDALDGPEVLKAGRAPPDGQEEAQVEALPLGGVALQHAADRRSLLAGVPSPLLLVVDVVFGEVGVPELAAVRIAGVVVEKGDQGRTGVSMVMRISSGWRPPRSRRAARRGGGGPVAGRAETPHASGRRRYAKRPPGDSGTVRRA